MSQKGIKRIAGIPMATSISPTNFKPTSCQRSTPKKCHKYMSVNKIHICRKRNSVQNFVSTLEGKGLSDAVVSNILRQRASSSISNVISLLGYGKMPLSFKILRGCESPESNIVTQNDIIELQRNLNLSNDQLHNICQFMKPKGLHTPNTRITQVLKEQNEIDFFESAFIVLEDSNGDKSPTEVIYCNDIDQLLKRVEEIRGKPLQLNRYGIDQGQDWLKVVLSPVHGRASIC